MGKWVGKETTRGRNDCPWPNETQRGGRRHPKIGRSALIAPIAILLMGGTPPPPDPPVPKSNEDDTVGVPAGVAFRTGGAIDTGNGYNIPGGMPQRTVVDFEVPGAVGQYPLRCARTLVAKPTTGPSQPWALVEWVFDFHYVYWSASAIDNVRYPNGTIVRFGRTPGIADRMRHEGSTPILQMADGGYVEFSRLAQSGSQVFDGEGDFWVGTRIVDPHGLVTAVVPHNVFGPRRVTDASGRWIEFTWSGNGVSRVTSSTGESVRYSLVEQVGNDWPLISEAWYDDGSNARYTYAGQNASCPGPNGTGYEATNLPLELRDTRAESRMPTVRFRYTTDPVTTYCVLESELAEDGTVVSTRINSTLETYRELRPSGAERVFVYGGSLLQSETDFRENTWKYEYDDTFFLNSVEDPYGAVTSAVNEDVLGKPLTVNFPGGASVHYTYTDVENPYFVKSVEDERGYVTTYHRFPNGVVKRIEYPDGSEESWDDLTAYAQPRVHVLRNGATERFEYDSMGRLLTHWLPAFGTPGGSDPRFRYTYYEDGHAWEDLLKTETDPRGNVTTYEYARAAAPPPALPGGTVPSASGRRLLSKIVFADGTFVSFKRDVFGNVVEETDEVGATTTLTYDSYNRLTSRTDQSGRETNYGYERGPQGNALSHTDHQPTNVFTPSGKLEHKRYDEGHRVVFEHLLGTHSSGGTSYTYDALGSLKTRTDASGRVTSYTYDSRGRPETTVAANNLTTSYEYDDSGNRTRVTYPDGTTRQWRYDGMSQTIRSIDERGRETSNLYIDGELRSVIDPQGRALGFVYDAQGRLDKRYVYGRLQEDLERDAAGNVLRRVDGEGTITEYHYDERNREWFRLYSDGTPSRQVEYDGVGRPLGLYDSNSQIEYTYDEAGRLKTETQTFLGYAGRAPRTVHYAHDADGVPFAASSQQNFVIAEYDSAGRVSRVLHRPMTTSVLDPPNVIVDYSYYADGKRFSKTFGNGVAVEFTYDAAGRLESQGGNTPQLWRHYDYDSRSRVTGVFYGLGWLSPGATFPESLGHTTFDYYDDSQLRLVTSAGVLAPDDGLYVYDDSGNRTANGLISYETNSENQYTSVGGQSDFDYDGNGHMTTQNGWSYEYDAESRMTRATDGTTDIEFTYDAAERLHSITKNGQTRYALYFSSPAAVLWYGTDERLLETDVMGTTPDEWLYTLRPDRAHYYHLDKQNSVIGTTDSGGQVSELYTYDGFGAPHVFSPNYVERASSNFDISYQYTGQRWLPDVQAYHYKARIFDPYLGRFLQVDPLGYGASDANLYRYVFNNPYQFTDPTGTIADGRDCNSPTMNQSGISFDSAGEGMVHRVAIPCEMQLDSVGDEIDNAAVAGPDASEAEVIARAAAGAVAKAVWEAFGAEAVSKVSDKLTGGSSEVTGTTTLMAIAEGAPGLGKVVKASVAVAKLGKAAPALEKLSQAGKALDAADKGKQLTKAGRSLMKHQAGGRAGSVKFPGAKGGPEAWNRAGQHQLDDILTSPGSTTKQLGRGGWQVTAPDGRGARFNADGSFSGFVEMSR